MADKTQQIREAGDDYVLEAIKQMKAYLAYQGANKEYRQKAIAACSGVSAITRSRSVANSENDLAFRVRRDEKRGGR